MNSGTPRDAYTCVRICVQFPTNPGSFSTASAIGKHDLEYVMKLLTSAKPECHDYLWKHFVFGMNYAEIAEEQNLKYDNVRMKIGRCLDEAKSLVA